MGARFVWSFLITSNPFTTMALLFAIGVVEMIIVTFWTQLVVETRVFMSGIVTLVNVLIWYYVLERIVSDISNVGLIIAYAVGCALGTMIATTLSLPRYRSVWEQWIKSRTHAMHAGSRV